MDKDETKKPVPTPCPECQGTRIVASAGDPLGVPFFRQGEIEGVREVIDYVCAVVCVQCGHTAFFVESPRKVRQALERYPQEFQEAALWFSQRENN